MNNNAHFKLSFVILVLFIYVEVISSIRRRKNHSNYIIGGVIVEESKPLPYVVQIGKYRGPIFYIEHYCGGTILTKRHVLTAAHCLEGRNYNSVRIRSGTLWKNYGGDITKVAGWWRHIFPEIPGHGDDIGVVLTKSDIPIHDSAQLVALAKVEPPDDVIVEAAGWGAESKRSSALKIVALQMTSGTPCMNGIFWFENGTYLCAISNKLKGPYYGDSGGPLIFNATQVGVIITAPIKFESTYLHIFTSVVKFQDFIDSCLARLSMSDP